MFFGTYAHNAINSIWRIAVIENHVTESGGKSKAAEPRRAMVQYMADDPECALNELGLAWAIPVDATSRSSYARRAQPVGLWVSSHECPITQDWKNDR